MTTPTYETLAAVPDLVFVNDGEEAPDSRWFTTRAALIAALDRQGWERRAIAGYEVVSVVAPSNDWAHYGALSGDLLARGEIVCDPTQWRALLRTLTTDQVAALDAQADRFFVVWPGASSRLWNLGTAAQLQADAVRDAAARANTPD